MRVLKWELFKEDVIFLKHLNSIVYIDATLMLLGNFMMKVLYNVTNRGAYNSFTKIYWVDFPRDVSHKSDDDFVN